MHHNTMLANMALEIKLRRKKLPLFLQPQEVNFLYPSYHFRLLSFDFIVIIIFGQVQMQFDVTYTAATAATVVEKKEHTILEKL